jgi:hypothetical protein
MTRVSAKFVPRLLIAEQKEIRLFAATDLLQCAESEADFLGNIITDEETWIYGYDPETKAKSSVWKYPSPPRPKKACEVGSKTKVLLTVFFPDQDVFVHAEFIPAGQTVNKEYYLQILRRLRDAVRRKRPEKWSSGNWQIHHDNAPSHSVQLVQHFLAKHEIPQVQQPPYSPDLAPRDYFRLISQDKTRSEREKF